MAMGFVRISCAVAAATALGVVLSGLGCTSEATDPVTQCEAETVESLKEMVVVEEGVLSSPRALNANDGVWSFRHAIENMAPAHLAPGDFVHQWLVNWVTTKEVNGFRTDRPTEERDATMRHLVVCPWLKRSPANACNDDCSKCASESLDLAQAPFRLIAIVNRLDQSEEVANEPNGEGRLAFALTQGAADDPASKPLPMSVIFEYQLRASRTRQEWAQAWHSLGGFPSFDERYMAALESVTNAFTKRGSSPGSLNGGSAIGQVRTNESALNWIWQQREFGLDPAGALTLRPVRNTPGEPLNGTPSLRQFIVTNQEAILANRYELPEQLRAGSADQLMGVWNVPDIDPKLRKAFAAGTCNGCHAFENPNVDTAFHISPFRKGTDKLSPFVYSRTGGDDELSRRARLNSRVRCGG